MDRSVTLRRVGFVVLVVNVALVVAKGGVWYVTGSLAVGSEAVNSLTDVLYSGVLLTGLYLTTQPPDHHHPHGHERIEPFVSLVVAVAIFAAALGVAWSALRTMRSGTVPRAAGSLAAVGVLAGGAGVKYGLYRYCRSKGEAVDSPALVATALDNRVDVLTALAALVGVVGVRLGVPLLDPVAALVVAVGITYAGYEVLRDNLPYLVGGAPSAELRSEIRNRALAHPAVEGVHDVVAHYVGPEVDVSLHVEVEGEITLLEAHDIETEIMQSIRALDEVDDVFVHVDPRELGEWKGSSGAPTDRAGPE